MRSIIQIFKKNTNIIKKISPILSFIIPFLLLYSLYPYSFEATWKGRTYYLFFLWLISLELILGWEKLQTSKVNKLWSIRTGAFIIALLLPTIYVIATNYYGLNDILLNISVQNHVYWANAMPISIEYLVFTMLFALIILLENGIKGLLDFSISTLFLGIIGFIYTVDNIYPFGTFTPFQIFVPTAAVLAANVLNLMGYQTSITITTDPTSGSLPYLRAWNPKNPLTEASFGIAWPCSGIDSLLIYTVTILLFLKKSAIPWKQRIIYFAIGAIITYFINILRIVTIFTITLNGGDWHQFHSYYGPLYSITWIISYLLIIIGTRTLWGKIKYWKTMPKQVLK
jgi:thaumarchaeosortase